MSITYHINFEKIACQPFYDGTQALHMGTNRKINVRVKHNMKWAKIGVNRSF